MSNVFKLKKNRIFDEVPEKEVSSLLLEAKALGIPLFGRTEDGTLIEFQIQSIKGILFLLGGTFSSEKNQKNDAAVTFSFVLENNKYLFKAIMEFKNKKMANVYFQTGLYSFQRRIGKRVAVPPDFFSIVRLTQVNNKVMRNFGKIIDVSPGGIGLWFPSDRLKLKDGDTINIVLNIRGRPPEEFQMRVVHKHVLAVNKANDASSEIKIGADFASIQKESLHKKNSLVMDIYRDIFSSLLKF